MEKSLSILVVEDDRVLSRILSSKLEPICQPPYGRVLTAETLSQAVEVIAKTKPDIILLDLSLPDSSPEETISIIGRIVRDSSVIVLTSVTESDLIKQAIQDGADDFLIKDPAVWMGDALSKSIERSLKLRAAKKNIWIDEVMARLQTVKEKLQLIEDNDNRGTRE